MFSGRTAPEVSVLGVLSAGLMMVSVVFGQHGLITPFSPIGAVVSMALAFVGAVELVYRHHSNILVLLIGTLPGVTYIFVRLLFSSVASPNVGLWVSFGLVLGFTTTALATGFGVTLRWTKENNQLDRSEIVRYGTVIICTSVVALLAGYYYVVTDVVGVAS